MTSQNIIDRVKHLLRLSRSTNVNEASNAAAHAQRLMTKHQIDLAALGDIDKDGEASTVVSALGKDALYTGATIPFWVRLLAVGMGHVNDCEVLLGTRSDTRTIGLVGTPLAISCVRYMFDYVRREIVRLASLHSAEHAARTGLRRPSTKWRNDFKIGAAHEVIRRMQLAREEIVRDASRTALMRLDTIRRQAKAWTDEHVSGAAPKPPVREVDGDAYGRGRLAAQDITLSADIALPEPS